MKEFYGIKYSFDTNKYTPMGSLKEDGKLYIHDKIRLENESFVDYTYPVLQGDNSSDDNPYVSASDAISRCLEHSENIISDDIKILRTILRKDLYNFVISPIFQRKIMVDNNYIVLISYKKLYGFEEILYAFDISKTLWYIENAYNIYLENK